MPTQPHLLLAVWDCDSNLNWAINLRESKVSYNYLSHPSRKRCQAQVTSISFWFSPSCLSYSLSLEDSHTPNHYLIRGGDSLTFHNQRPRWHIPRTVCVCGDSTASSGTQKTIISTLPSSSLSFHNNHHDWRFSVSLLHPLYMKIC